MLLRPPTHFDDLSAVLGVGHANTFTHFQPVSTETKELGILPGPDNLAIELLPDKLQEAAERAQGSASKEKTIARSLACPLRGIVGTRFGKRGFRVERKPETGEGDSWRVVADPLREPGEEP